MAEFISSIPYIPAPLRITLILSYYAFSMVLSIVILVLIIWGTIMGIWWIRKKLSGEKMESGKPEPPRSTCDNDVCMPEIGRAHV